MESRTTALRFIILLGIVSLFGDVTYEGARSIIGPYLLTLGASGAIVGTVVGFGDLLGYGMRLFSGYVSDQTQKYWLITFVGYIINLLAVPLLALAGNWQVAALLIILERFGKAIRVPARDTMLSFATKHTGRGWGFGLHESLDQVGAIIGPLLITGLLYMGASYKYAFALLLIPALASLATLTCARITYPNPKAMEKVTHRLRARGFSKAFWIYLVGVGFVALGFTNYALISYHFQKAATIPTVWIPFFYAIAMAIDGLTALLIGRIFDIKGLAVLPVIILFTALFVPLVFIGGFYAALAGTLLWGISMGTQETLMRAAIPAMASAQLRGSAYGLFNLGFGLCGFVGSALMGFLYDFSIPTLIFFSLATQLLSIPFFLLLKKGNLGKNS